MTKTQKLASIIADIYYQTYHGETTMSFCGKGCGNPARGGNTCIHCLEEQLAAMVGAEEAALYIATITMVNHLESKFQTYARKNTQTD